MKRRPLPGPNWGAEDDPVCLVDGRSITDRWTGWTFTCPPQSYWSKPKIDRSDPIGLIYTCRDRGEDYVVQIIPDLGPIGDTQFHEALEDITKGMVNQVKKAWLRSSRHQLQNVRVRSLPQSTVTHAVNGEPGIRLVATMNGVLKEDPDLTFEMFMVTYSWLLPRGEDDGMYDSVVFRFICETRNEPVALEQMAVDFDLVEPEPRLWEVEHPIEVFRREALERPTRSEPEPRRPARPSAPPRARGASASGGSGGGLRPPSGAPAPRRRSTRRRRRLR